MYRVPRVVCWPGCAVQCESPTRRIVKIEMSRDGVLKVLKRVWHSEFDELSQRVF